jgi:hypothetical protein
MKTDTSEAIVVDNADYEQVAKKVEMQYIIILSKYFLPMNDFKYIIDHDTIFEETKYATRVLESWYS